MLFDPQIATFFQFFFFFICSPFFKQVCSYFKDPLVCIGTVAMDKIVSFNSIPLRIIQFSLNFYLNSSHSFHIPKRFHLQLFSFFYLPYVESIEKWEENEKKK